MCMLAAHDKRPIDVKEEKKNTINRFINNSTSIYMGCVDVFVAKVTKTKNSTYTACVCVGALCTRVFSAYMCVSVDLFPFWKNHIALSLLLAIFRTIDDNKQYKTHFNVSKRT